MNDRPDWLTVAPVPESRPVDLVVWVKGLLVIGGGLLLLVPPVYATVMDWRGENGEHIWSHNGMLACSFAFGFYSIGVLWIVAGRFVPSNLARAVILFCVGPAMAFLHYAIYLAVYGSPPEAAGKLLFKFVGFGLCVGCNASLVYLWFVLTKKSGTQSR